MAQWTAFVGLTTVVLFLLLALARLSQSVGDGADPTDATDAAPDRSSDAPGDPVGPRPLAESAPGLDVTATVDRDAQYTPLEVGRYPDSPRPAERTVAGLADPELPTAALLLNVALSQGVLGAFLLFGAFYTEIPASALGVDLADPLSTGLPALAVGTGVGVALYLVNVAGAAVAAAAGFEYDESLRDVLTPGSRAGWGLLLLAVLPLIAGFEELLFRAALVGAFGEGLALSPWLLAVASSLAFAVGHGAQGRMGMLVTGVLGFVIAGVFVLTNSLLAVVLAHYLVNALEFVVGGYFGVEWT